MVEQKRIITYELNIKTFKDSTNNGVGDFNGLIEKIEYFKTLKTDVIFIKDILGNYQNIENLEEVNERYGSLNDFFNLVKVFQKHNIEICPIIDLSNIKQTYLNWKNMMLLYSDNFDTTKEIEWKSMYSKYIISNNINPNANIVDLANFILYFDKIINFYNECGIKNFALENFEFLLDFSMFEKRHNKFEKIIDLYKMIKRINPSASIILKFNTYNKKILNSITKNKEKCFDYLYLTYFSKIGINQETPYKHKVSFDYKTFASQYSKFISSARYILCLSSSLSGRINSMWGDEKAYNYEAAKAFLLTLFSGKNSIGIYYGDELGMLKSQWIGANDNKNKSNEEKRFYESLKIPFEKYKEAKHHQSPENSASLMSWNASNYSGFSTNSKYDYAPSINYKNNNVENELNNTSSPLNFYLNLVKLIWNFKFNGLYSRLKLKVNFLNASKLMKINWKGKDINLVFLINLSSKNINNHFAKNHKILLSSYAHKVYTSIPKTLSPFESLILIKATD